MKWSLSEDSAIELVVTVISACITIAAIFISDRVNLNSESRRDRTLVKNTYLGPLYLTIYDVVRRIQDLKNENHQNQLKCICNVKDIIEKEDSWFYYEGNFFCSSVYLMASLIARIQYVKENLPVMSINKREYEGIINHIRNIETLFRCTGHLWIIIQYDIASNMNPTGNGNFISYNRFCSEIRDSKGNAIYQKLIYAVMNAAEYYEAIAKLEEELKSFNTLLSTIINISDTPLYRKRATLIK